MESTQVGAGGGRGPPVPLWGRGGAACYSGSRVLLYQCNVCISVFHCIMFKLSCPFISCYPILQILRHWQYFRSCESCQGRIKAAGTYFPRRTHIFLQHRLHVRRLPAGRADYHPPSSFPLLGIPGISFNVFLRIYPVSAPGGGSLRSSSVAIILASILDY